MSIPGITSSRDSGDGKQEHDSGPIWWRGWKAAGRGVCLFVSLFGILAILLGSAGLGGRLEALVEGLIKDVPSCLEVIGVASYFRRIENWSVFGELLSALSGLAKAFQWSAKTVAFALPAVFVAVMTAIGKAAVDRLKSGFVDGLRSAAKASEKYVLGDARWLEWATASAKPSLSLALMFCGGGWYGLTVEPEPNEVTYLVRESERGRTERRTMAVPVNLHVGFERARLDASDNPSGPGVELEPSRWKALEPTVGLLEKCAEKLEDGLRVQLFGFASDESFRSFEDDKQKNKKLNLKTANKRASSVGGALREIAGKDSRIEIRVEDWQTSREMRRSRKIIVGADPEDHYAHRAVVLQVPELGNCEIEAFEPSEPKENE